MELLFDDEFGLSDCEVSKGESEDAYCYGVRLNKKSLENFVRQVGFIL